MDPPQKSRKPEDTPFKQQKLAAWQPILTPVKVIVIFLSIGIIFVPVGVTLLQESASLYESTITYDGSGSIGSCSITEANQGRNCYVTFTMTRDVTGPLYVYYELENFYQNHRRYVKSRSPYQLMGLDGADPETECDPLVYNGTTLLYPCGLIANSLFNDVISLSSVNHTLDSGSISWPSDRKVKFKQPEGFKKALVVDGQSCTQALGVPVNQCKSTVYKGQNWYYFYPNDDSTQYLYESFPQIINPIEGVENEHFIVWMRTAGLPTFRKLYGKIRSDFKEGDQLSFQISNNFEVVSFDGKKSLVISTIGSFGGKNSFLGIAYIVVGSVCLLLTILFGLKQMIYPRDLGDAKYLGWSA
mmetsp:Transcript_21833/g.22010  ORF Transcript_21833/g.22010 Transcript_21833/m.22010 type:complete len:358 (-) Transcript_21833:289-1362(-)